jgi:hypothetical protein
MGASEPRADPQDLISRALAILDEKGAPKNQSGDLPLRRQILSDGTECPLPIRYFDAQYLSAAFLCDSASAAELLVGTGLQPLPQEDGQSVVVFFCGEYRDTDIGPYNEVGLSILSVVPGDPRPGIYVSNLPVTSSIAYRAGTEIWGFNKFVATIDINREGNKFASSVRDLDNLSICTFEGARCPCIATPPVDLRTFSMLKGKLLATRTQVLTPLQVGPGPNLALKVGASVHPMAINLKNLGLDGKSPILVQYADPAQALLFPGATI